MVRTDDQGIVRKMSTDDGASGVATLALGST